MMKTIIVTAIMAMFVSCKKTSNTNPLPNPIGAGDNTPPAVYEISDKIKWADEFDTDGAPSNATWGYDLGGDGWGNNEKQTYTNSPENVHIKNGMLKIIAKRNPDGPEYTSTRLITKGKKDFLYGRIEIRAKLPRGRGTWPAIWTLASQSGYGEAFWPDNGELDIMEHVGFDQDRVHNNIHTKAYHHSIGTNKGNSRMVTDVSDKFHTYTMDWLPSSVVFLIDGEKNFEFKRETWHSWREWPFDKPQHLLINIAVGGNWGGAQGIDNSVFPQQMEVDYVRYYEAVKKQ
jgi:beta-glucanase (GH16 family)